VASIRNRKLLETVFGSWPSFHDTEVIAVRLGRGAPDDRPSPWLEADIHGWETTRETTAGGYFVTRLHTRVTFGFYGVDEVQLVGFNRQNVLFDLKFDDIGKPQVGGPRWSVSFQSSFGLSGSFDCEEIQVLRVGPYEPSPPGSS
jgi:hypothetical protein